MDNYIGTLLGGCCGDVLGSLTEGLKRSEILSKYPNLRELPRSKLYTDDTEMTISLAEHLVENGGVVDLIKVHKSYAERMSLNKGYSKTTRTILEKIIKGETLYQGHSDHNGAVMRISPLGLIPFDNDEILVKNIERALYFSHSTDCAKACAYLHCKVIRALVEGRFTNKNELFKYILEKSIVYSLLFTKMNIVKFCLITNFKDITYELTGNTDTFQINAIDCLCCAYYIFFANYDVPLEAVCYAASIGGDTDTIAKIVGELCGALHGTKWIPESWRGVENKKLLIELAEKLYTFRSIYK